MQILTWAQIQRIHNGSDPQPDIFKRGSALTVGSFDGPHTGHDVLFNAVIDASKSYGFLPGAVTFTESLGGFKRPASYEGDLSTLDQRLAVLDAKGMGVVIVIDFSIEFGRIEGQDFLSILKKSCGLRFIAEGKDFRCGYRGAFGMDEIIRYSALNGIQAQFPEPVLYKSERVSSSLIRSCIIRSDFSSAAEMLGRRYALDCSKASWAHDGNMLSAERRDFMQVLPPPGQYDVAAITPGNRIRMRLNVGPHFLRLEVPAGDTLPCIRAVEFISNY